jgi:type II secretory pathway predicted ATPase ExeA
MLRERIVQAKLREIRQNLRLDQATFDRFRPVYLKYEKEVSGINLQKMARLLRVDADSLSIEEADQLILNQIESAKSLIALREKYYKEFRTVLSPQQIIKLYQTEAELRKKVMQELKRRLMSQ